MARPEKHTVDYFPHYCVPGKTMFILETRFQDKGYAFWFKVLETLGSTEGHAYHFGNVQDRSYLEARTRTTTEQATEILDLLADLDAIDKELWKSDKIIWSDNFVAGIKDAYRNRTVDLPIKPTPTVVSDVRNSGQLELSSKNDAGNSHSIVNKNKVKETKEYGVGKNVLLTDEEFGKLKERFNGETEIRIDRLSAYMGSTGKKYKSHYLTILNWANKDGDQNGQSRAISGRDSTPGNRPTGAFADIKAI